MTHHKAKVLSRSKDRMGEDTFGGNPSGQDGKSHYQSGYGETAEATLILILRVVYCPEVVYRLEDIK